MDFAFDLHIHSVLSPCGDEDMTPNNIVNMAVIKGIDVISVTDHNTALNLPALSKTAIEKGIFFLPGIEVQTKEEIHMLCYFKAVDQAVEFGNIIYNKLPDIKNNPEVFGRQLIMDSDDNITGSIDKLLLSSANVSINQLVHMINEFNGVCIPAHVDRSSYSIISNIGFIPDNLNIPTVEISKLVTIQSATSKFPFLNTLRIIKSSDAHYLWDISERENLMPLDFLSSTNIINYLKNH